MKKVVAGLMIFMCTTATAASVAESDDYNKQQAVSVTGENMEIESSEEMRLHNDYQDQILSNPETNAAARAGAFHSGGNTAIINQHGSSNSASVIQSGNNNFAEQTQIGTKNDIYLKQAGEQNWHSETQSGSNNRKMIIRNDSETIIDQVSP